MELTFNNGVLQPATPNVDRSRMVGRDGSGSVIRDEYLKKLSSYGLEPIDGPIDTTQAVLQDDLLSRILDYEALLPSTSMPTYGETVAAFERFRNLSDYGKSVLAGMGVDIQNYNWHVPTYPEFELEVRDIEADFNASGVSIDVAFPVFSEAYGAFDQGQGKKALRKTTILSKLAAALGIKEGWQAMVAVLEKEYPELLRALARNIALKNWGRVAKVLRKILGVIMTKAFWRAMIKKVGAQTTKKIIGRIMARWVPFLGWILIIGSLIWAFAEELL